MESIVKATTRNLDLTRKKRKSRRHGSEWFDCGLADVENLPYDIDGICIYQLNFDMTQRMRSTLDGRP